VNHADAIKVILYDIRRASKPQREVPLFRDDTYEVRWASEGGFTYFRHTDNIRMAATVWPTPEAAKAALIRDQYPSRMVG
jgi:hypothetical protein